MSRSSHSSQISGFHNLTLEQRRQWLQEWAGLGRDDMAALEAGLPLEQADKLIENVAGRYTLPLGIATNFLVNGKDYLVPMVIEEPSVVAGVSFAAKLLRMGGGIHAEAIGHEMIGQIQVLDLDDLDDLDAVAQSLRKAQDRILARANDAQPGMVARGGGAKGLEIRTFRDTSAGPMLVLHILVDTADAMGANAVNTVAEVVAPLVEEITGGRVNLRILSNLADRRMARAGGKVPASALERAGRTGEQVVRGIVEAAALAEVDPYRAATHNKGIMNGVDAVAIATGNDWRALEAGAHAYAARAGQYASLSRWRRGADGSLVGSLEMPLAVGIAGGATRSHPTARVALKILRVGTAAELAEVVAAVGLAQNLAALRALADEGIQRGHMALHARQVALAAGAEPEEAEVVAHRMVTEANVRPQRALEILEEIRTYSDSSDLTGKTEE